jgi:hypothetical protein
MGVKNARPVTLISAKLVIMTSKKATMGIASNAIEAVLTVLSNLTPMAADRSHKLAWLVIRHTPWWIQHAWKFVLPPPTVLIPAKYATLQKQAVFATVVLQTLNAIRISPDNILSVINTEVSAMVVVSHINKMFVEKIKHVFSTRTIRDTDAANAIIWIIPVARGKMVKTYAMKI